MAESQEQLNAAWREFCKPQRILMAELRLANRATYDLVESAFKNGYNAGSIDMAKEAKS